MYKLSDAKKQDFSAKDGENFISIDPGLRGCGVALWEGGVLVRAFYAANPDKKSRGAVAWVSMAREVKRLLGLTRAKQLVIEQMQAYTGGKIDRNDILEVNGVVGAIAGALELANYYSCYPKTWNGGRKKEVTAANTKQAKESQVPRGRIELPSKSLEHNVYDAIGIGLWWHKQCLLDRLLEKVVADPRRELSVRRNEPYKEALVP